MIAFLVRRAIAAFERRWNYDASYMREVVAVGGLPAIVPLQALSTLSTYRRDVPVSVYYVTKVTAALAADCGPCAQLAVTMALAEGIDSDVIRAIVAGNRSALGDDERLSYDFARAILAREPAGDVRERIRERWGSRALVSLAYALVAAQAYPTFKVAMGYGHACTLLHAGDVQLQREAVIG